MGAPFIIANFTLEQLIRGEGESVESMIGNYLFKVNGVIFSLLAAEAISFVTGLALYQIEKVRTIRK